MKSYTPITEATTYSYTSLCDAQFSRLSDAERYKYAVSCDCKAWSESELIMDCEFVASDPRAGNVTMSAHELASLRIPSETCKGIYDNKKNASMVGATADAWKTLDWSSCIWGGKVVCVDERGEDLSCHYFYHPFKYDLARVWEAVVRYLKPSRCLITNNAELDANVRQLDFHVRVRGRAAANWINADLPDTWQQKLHNELGLSFSSQRTDPGCSGTYNACQLPKEGCRCIEGRFNADAVGPSEEDVAWGYVTDFFVAAKEMKGNYSLFQALGYSPKSCKFECFNSKIRTISGYRKELIEYWGRANNSFKATPTFTNV
ncbi:hypothetical protein GNI_100220 [Gregarina niphandrodes]|uniref:Uncharacterized protein n=1 Tax=Gregarina niphandrodes TaxID=110365 RepID=A0A023B4N5_GRENI|nr:hypothetical protein GNI_100220 [Gregarina niphandrodes]EZG56873.1 hypothetical protein GNI_100220 [Gregarina niphandrodes]|eukprot:XP_011131122.1 hypothetical protein GNI_100220 [Gregarina niphandrodes]